MEPRKYGLFTAVAMITGIVIGSGIFFKSYNILVFTGGNVLLGVVIFCLCAFGIVFGSLAIAQLASRSDKIGGVITYAEQFCSPRIACCFGWFHTFLYYPTLAAVVSWVAGIYTCTLFGWENTLERQVLVGLGWMALLFLQNVLSARLGGYFQNASTVIKLIPLVLLAAAGLIWGRPGELLARDLQSTAGSSGWIAAIGAVAFSFDGWIVSTSIAHEIKDSRRNLPLALLFAPLLILAVYILYFVGVCALLGPEEIMALGPDHTYYAAQLLLGSGGAKVLLVFIIISVLGTVNGLVLGLLRMPAALSRRKMLFGAGHFVPAQGRMGASVPSAALSFGVCLLWMGIHYATQRWGLLPNSDVSEISIAVNYLAYIFLYGAVMRLARSGEISSVWWGYAVPALAIVGSCFILMGGLSNPLFPWYLCICGAVIAAALLYYQGHREAIGTAGEEDPGSGPAV